MPRFQIVSGANVWGHIWGKLWFGMGVAVVAGLVMTIFSVASWAADCQTNVSNETELQTALTCVADGGTITVASDFSVDNNLIIDKNVTIAGGTTPPTVDLSWDNTTNTGGHFQIAGGKIVTLKNLILSGHQNPVNNSSWPGATLRGLISLNADDANLTLENVQMSNPVVDMIYAGQGKGNAVSNLNIRIENSTLTSSSNLAQAITMDAENSTIYLSQSTIQVTSNGQKSLVTMRSGDGNTLTLDESKILNPNSTSGNYAITMDHHHQTVNILNGSEINAWASVVIGNAGEPSNNNQITVSDSTLKGVNPFASRGNDYAEIVIEAGMDNSVSINNSTLVSDQKDLTSSNPAQYILLDKDAGNGNVYRGNSNTCLLNDQGILNLCQIYQRQDADGNGFPIEQDYFSCDRTAPELTVTQPSAGYYTGRTANISGTATDAITGVDNTSLKLHLLAADQTTELASWPLPAPDADGNWTDQLDLTDQSTYSGNVYYVQLTGADNGLPANTGTSALVKIIANQYGDTVTIDRPQDGALLSGRTDVSGSATNNLARASNLFFNARSLARTSRVAALAERDCQLDQPVTAISQANWSFDFDTRTCADGRYQLEVYGLDASGDRVPSNLVTVTIDNTAPVITLSPSTRAGGKLTLSGTFTDNLSGIQDLTAALQTNGRAAGCLSDTPIQVDADGRWTFQLDTAACPDGQYRLVINGSDRAGNRATQTVDFLIQHGQVAGNISESPNTAAGGSQTRLAMVNLVLAAISLALGLVLIGKGLTAEMRRNLRWGWRILSLLLALVAVALAVATTNWLGTMGSVDMWTWPLLVILCLQILVSGFTRLAPKVALSASRRRTSGHA